MEVSEEVAAEVRLREELARPVLTGKKVIVGAGRRRDQVCGDARARRSVAQHAFLGKGNWQHEASYWLDLFLTIN